MVAKTIAQVAKKKQMQKFLYLVSRDKELLVLLIPSFILLVLFFYIPMFGIYIAFVNFLPGRSIFASDFVGVKWFLEFFNSIYFWRLLRNTFLISLYSLMFAFPLPIAFALLLHEVKCTAYKKIVQTASYMPHFISIMVIVGMLFTFLDVNGGVVNRIIAAQGGTAINFMGESSWFRGLYVGTNVWQEFGWNSIIYLAAMSGIDPTLYEAARIDGTNRWQQMVHITLPSISPTIIIILILTVGGMLNVGFEKIILMYSPSTYETADVISTYVYRRGLVGGEYSFGTAVGLFNSIIGFALIVLANIVSKKVSEVSLF